MPTVAFWLGPPPWVRAEATSSASSSSPLRCRSQATSCATSSTPIPRSTAVPARPSASLALTCTCPCAEQRPLARARKLREPAGVLVPAVGVRAPFGLGRQTQVTEPEHGRTLLGRQGDLDGRRSRRDGRMALPTPTHDQPARRGGPPALPPSRGVCHRGVSV